MAKKNISSLISGIMGDAPVETSAAPQAPRTPEPAPVPAPAPVEEAPAVKRGPGRPRKDPTKTDETRATFIVNPDHVRKLKYISLADDRLLKEVIFDALDQYIEAWEEENGEITLAKKK